MKLYKSIKNICLFFGAYYSLSCWGNPYVFSITEGDGGKKGITITKGEGEHLDTKQYTIKSFESSTHAGTKVFPIFSRTENYSLNFSILTSNVFPAYLSNDPIFTPFVDFFGWYRFNLNGVTLIVDMKKMSNVLVCTSPQNAHNSTPISLTINAPQVYICNTIGDGLRAFNYKNLTIHAEQVHLWTPYQEENNINRPELYINERLDIQATTIDCTARIKGGILSILAPEVTFSAYAELSMAQIQINAPTEATESFVANHGAIDTGNAEGCFSVQGFRNFINYKTGTLSLFTMDFDVEQFTNKGFFNFTNGAITGLISESHLELGEFICDRGYETEGPIKIAYKKTTSPEPSIRRIAPVIPKRKPLPQPTLPPTPAINPKGPEVVPPPVPVPPAPLVPVPAHKPIPYYIYTDIKDIKYSGITTADGFVKDFRSFQPFYPIPLIFHYRKGGDDSKYSSASYNIKIFDYSKGDSLSGCPKPILDIVRPFIQNVEFMRIVCKITPGETECNYFTHLWSMDRMIEDRLTNVLSGFWDAQNIAGIDLKSDCLTLQKQSFHDRSYLSPKNSRFNITAFPASAWFLSVYDPDHNKPSPNASENNIKKAIVIQWFFVKQDLKSIPNDPQAADVVKYWDDCKTLQLSPTKISPSFKAK